MCQWYADCSLQIKERESTFHSQLHIAHPQTRKQANTPHPTRSRSHALTLNAQRSTLNAFRLFRVKNSLVWIGEGQRQKAA